MALTVTPRFFTASDPEAVSTRESLDFGDGIDMRWTFSRTRHRLSHVRRGERRRRPEGRLFAKRRSQKRTAPWASCGAVTSGFSAVARCRHNDARLSRPVRL